jgi:hypothetical protein
MYVNSDVNVLSFEGSFVILHPGTVLIVNVYCLFCTYKDTNQLSPCQLFPRLFHNNLPICGFLRTFAPQPDEETGSAEEQPASNMAVPALEAVFQEPSYPWAAH